MADDRHTLVSLRVIADGELQSVLVVETPENIDDIFDTLEDGEEFVFLTKPDGDVIRVRRGDILIYGLQPKIHNPDPQEA